MAFQVDEPTPFALKQHGSMRPPNPLVDLILLGLLFEPQIPPDDLVEAKRELADPQALITIWVPRHPAWPPRAPGFAEVRTKYPFHPHYRH